MRCRLTRLLAVLAALALAALCAAPAPALASPDARPRWVWPGGVAQVIAPFERPSHEYGPGHRGVDIAVSGEHVVAPDDGVVAFRGTVVDRPLITIDHGGGLVSTLEPVDSELSAGDPVARGSVVGTLASGGHTPPGALHLGARLDGEYIDPLGLLGALERPVLLPCC
ncbi:murein hydrolase activator EnvC family protein [Microbacterium karelineae]|uniref:murein hydrolase activator EnvC family protein n=1 Tax=Microbacterium karelineae TaxID=2654283 RepID=UPI0012EABFED|nr:M23 family metallopeptidase [Microbacterium karelineae]